MEQTTEEKVKDFFQVYGNDFLQKLKELEIDIILLFEEYGEEGIITALKLKLQPIIETNPIAKTVFARIINRTSYPKL